VTEWRVFVLLGLDPSLGLAVRPVGVLGVEPGGFHVSFVPYEPAVDAWRDRILTAEVGPVQALESWLESADGVAFDILEVSPPDSPDLRTAVESVVDELLASLPAE
jgi:hypothetical protein